VTEQIQHITENKLQESVGPEFSLMKKLKIGGSGSMKMIHIEGIELIAKFDSTSKSQHYLSFELRPNALIGRTNGDPVKTFFIRKEAVSSIIFETYNLRIVTKTGIFIRHEALVYIVIDKRIIKLYVPRNAYKPVKKFFGKDWLKEKIDFTLSSAEPELNYNALIADIISRLIGW
jgi:hypothetical protein